MILDWTQATTSSLLQLWVGFVAFLPSLIGAVLILIVGWLVAGWLGKFVAEVLKRVKFDNLFERAHWKEAIQKSDIKVTPSGFLGAITKWVLIIVFLSAAAEILGLDRFAGFLQSIIAFVPNVVMATLIFVVTVVIVDILEKVLHVTTEGMQIGYGNAVAVIVRWAVWIFAILAILNQLRMNTDIFGDSFKIVLGGVVGMLALAGGLAFGLGGREAASQIIDGFRKKFRA